VVLTNRNPFEGSPIPQTTACKCCQSPADLAGLADFSRCGADMIAHVMATGQPVYPDSLITAKADPYLGWPIYFHRCRTCGFTFTRAFDAWDREMFARHIYNDEYVRHDPEYRTRHLEYAQRLVPRLGPTRRDIRILDYGSGLGLLELELKQQGCPYVESYDPFTHPERPQGHFDLIVCVEVFEHAPDPVALTDDIAELLRPGSGALLFSTLCCPQSVIDAGIGQWWYCAPRNGHISFYTPDCLTLLANRSGLQYRRLDDYRHLMCHTARPGWLESFIAP
jgi:SAM-dependent methyltransferase